MHAAARSAGPRSPRLLCARTRPPRMHRHFRVFLPSTGATAPEDILDEFQPSLHLPLHLVSPLATLPAAH
eukprot:147681-Pleurochrysis_carterae.AAC.3